jgi:heat shock protein HslJ
MVRTVAATVGAALLLLTACTTPPGEGTAENGSANSALADTRWTLQALGNDGGAGNAAVTLNFGPDGTIAGNDGCNQFRGDYAVEGQSIEIGGNLAGTAMACADPIGVRARAYREALHRAANFALDDTRLDLNDATGRRLVSLVPASISPVGADWEVVAYNNGKQAIVSLIIDSQVTASFGTDGQVTGTTGCNQYFASYELEGQSLGIGPAGATRRFCAEPEGLMQQEALYLEALQSAAEFGIDGMRLELRRADGALAVTFNRKEP